MRVRAKVKGSETNVKVLCKHPMESGFRKDKKTGEKVPAHFIQDLTCNYKGNKVMVASLGPAVSKNPYINFIFSGGAVGEKLEFTWIDNKGKTETATAIIK